METLSRFTCEAVAALAAGDAYMRPAPFPLTGRGRFVSRPFWGTADLPGFRPSPEWRRGARVLV